MKSRLLIVSNDAESFLMHRLPETLEARRNGFEVHVATPAGKAVKELIKLEFVHHNIPLSRSGRNPIREIFSFISIYRLLKELKPDIVYLITIKPIIYGGIAARFAGIDRVVAAIFGLGFLFTNHALYTRLVRKLVTYLYRLALMPPKIRIVFQNNTDRQLMIKLGAVAIEKTVLIQGSGVDLTHFVVQSEPQEGLVVLMASRLLYDKGVLEYIEAARELRKSGVKARFLLAGDIDNGNPSSLTASELNGLRTQGDIELLGFCKDMPRLLAEVNLVVLPSYREGLPRVLEEAAAAGRAIVTTNAPGCRDAIEANITGLLVPPRNVPDLAKAIRALLEDPPLRKKMGEAGRRLAERKYSVETIASSHFRIYEELLKD